ncbi:MAG TPA: PQQ-dependent dehydrogenase, methanol/ethanol family [Vicinamibacterales bacterium]|nr:PQQ-dependent dehydrogenase, methanol/ethanol family [Vicinamibacterales bacterium]
MRRWCVRGALVVLGAAALVATVAAQGAPPPLVSAQELLDGLKADGSRWLMFGGNYTNQRHSPLTQITPANVSRLVPQWVFQTDTPGRFESTPLVRDNVLYVTGPLNVAWAIDARTGREIWRYKRELPPTGSLTACCGLVNRGFGVLGDRLFMTTLDAHLLALDMKTGAVVWDATLEDFSQGYAATIAPLVVKDKVIVGVAGGEYGIRGFIDAYDAKTGKRAWRFYTIPGPGERGNDTWAGDSWQRGGASIWVTGAYDPELNLAYYGIGNPGPDYHSESRKGDNLYSDSLVALDVDTGTLRWHYQFTPHDLHDWDATQVPILADLTIAGQPRKVVMLANRNGFFYTLDRTNGKLIVGKPYVVTTWAKEIGSDGRPVILPGYVPDEKGSLTCPDVTGATNFWPPSYDPSQHLFFVNAREVCATYYAWKQEYVPGERYTGGAGQRATGPDMRAFGALRAIDPATGERRWEFQYISPSTAGVLTTASGLVFSGDAEGNFLALDSHAGKLLWRFQMGSALHGTSPITYMLDGRQQILVPAGGTLTAWALGDVPRVPSTR